MYNQMLYNQIYVIYIYIYTLKKSFDVLKLCAPTSLTFGPSDDWDPTRPAGSALADSDKGEAAKRSGVGVGASFGFKKAVGVLRS